VIAKLDCFMDLCNPQIFLLLKAFKMPDFYYARTYAGISCMFE